MKSNKGQSFVELALTMPVLLLLLGGMVEVGVFINQYLNALDLTREAARFASGLDAYGTPGDNSCATVTDFNYYYDTGCVFSPPADPPGRCPFSTFCNGVNSYLPYKPDQDDVVITIVAVIEDSLNVQHIVRWPDDDGWALSNNDNGVGAPDPGSAYSDNWKEDCKNKVVQPQPYFSDAEVSSFLNSAAPGTKGFVVIEYYYCYYQILHLPVFYQTIPDPIRMHNYTVMPAILPARCMDKVDNDNDGKTDFDGAGGGPGAADLECLDSLDSNEDF